MQNAVLVINVGSSSIRFAAYEHAASSGESMRLCGGAVDGLDAQPRLTVDSRLSRPGDAERRVSTDLEINDHAGALRVILSWLDAEASDLRLVAAGHRVVHGGAEFSHAVRVDKQVMEKLRALVPMAPLHQPHALGAIENLVAQRPGLPQVACFDTAFHAGMPACERRFALPVDLYRQGIRRYGFHGLSYEYIAGVLPSHLGKTADGKVVLAHLGHGVSMCALENRRSLATTMSFTPLDGLPMGTRSGAVDPAIVLYLVQNGMSIAEVSDMLHHRSGLLGLSGISGDMRQLLASRDAAASEAVAYFCYRVGRELGSLSAALGGLDALVFTGGIGEHAAPVRARICRMAAWLGIEIDDHANESNALRISTDLSRVSVWVIPTDEEQVIARSTIKLLHAEGGSS